jgi:hypothetical protein
MAASVLMVHRLPMLSRGVVLVDAKAMDGTEAEARNMETVGSPHLKRSRKAKGHSLDPRVRFAGIASI